MMQSLPRGRGTTRHPHLSRVCVVRVLACAAAACCILIILMYTRLAFYGSRHVSLA